MAMPADVPSADARYFGKLAEGIFEIPRCRTCSRHHFFPRVCCPHCGSQDLEWVAPAGAGVVYSSTIVRRPGGDYTVCLVDLQEGPRLMSRVVDIPVDEVRIGMAVRARIDQTTEGPLLVFIPEGARS
ncbi:Zn-ribbon domain-containing OB-fold protein [Noviherbaspirillum saxi]|uniref:DNA-binding protein n=1 Tax=Noviherbaspirillum saxi TaxID=2320863 RepID=A0A3A3FI40_9BURK|nr:OB-fold domain-containing protein [Noviherbaspirillum saxi]RJF92820.1 DNA-binding protein [Noviherbaspirillum saxi]